MAARPLVQRSARWADGRRTAPQRGEARRHETRRARFPGEIRLPQLLAHGSLGAHRLSRRGRLSGRRATQDDACFAFYVARADRLPEEHHQCPTLHSAAAESGALTTTSHPSPNATDTVPRCPPSTPSTPPTASRRETAGPPGISRPAASAGPGRTQAGWSPT